MTEVIALRPLTYGPRRLRAGDRFDVSPAYARLMAALGHVKLTDDRVTQTPECDLSSPFEYQRSALLVEAQEEPKPKRRKRTYKRRDMRAED